MQTDPPDYGFEICEPLAALLDHASKIAAIIKKLPVCFQDGARHHVIELVRRPFEMPKPAAESDSPAAPLLTLEQRAEITGKIEQFFINTNNEPRTCETIATAVGVALLDVRWTLELGVKAVVFVRLKLSHRDRPCYALTPDQFSTLAIRDRAGRGYCDASGKFKMHQQPEPRVTKPSPEATKTDKKITKQKVKKTAKDPTIVKIFDVFLSRNNLLRTVRQLSIETGEKFSSIALAIQNRASDFYCDASGKDKKYQLQRSAYSLLQQVR